jgi:hypothetical protein
MKKSIILAIVTVISLSILPSKVFAAVDLTASDSTASDGTKTVTLNVNTGEDSLNQIAFDVQTSDNVTISKAVATQYTCDSFSYSNDNHILKVQCTFDTATKLSGSIGTVTFTSTSDTYSFTILNNSDLNLGGLTLGNIVNVSETGTTVTSTDTTSNTQTTTDTTTSIKGQITNYLPYVLIGGAAILLISILGIVLGKKKDYPLATTTSKTEKKLETPILPKVSEPIPSTSMEAKIRPTLPTTPERPEISTVITKEEKPPVVDNNNIPNVKVSEDKQSKDLEEILKMETASSPMAPIPENNTPTAEVSTGVPSSEPILPAEGPSTPVVETSIPVITENEPPVVASQESITSNTPQYFSSTAPEIATSATVSNEAPEILPSEKPVMEINTAPQAPLPDLQSFIDTQIGQIPNTPLQPTETAPTQDQAQNAPQI